MRQFNNKRANLRRKKKSKYSDSQNIQICCDCGGILTENEINGDRIIETGTFGHMPIPKEKYAELMKQVEEEGLSDYFKDFLVEGE